MKERQLEGQSTLVKEVLEKRICIRCGACVGLCPYFQYYDGKVVVVDSCSADTWRCLQVCPRLPYDRASLYAYFYGKRDMDMAVGPYISAVAARSTYERVRNTAQYGGVVTSLLLYALEKGKIKAAVLTDRGENMAPRGILCDDTEGILDCSGSRYSASAAIGELNAAIKSGKEALGFVGLPCQMEALGRMELSEPDGKERASHIELKIGLFCTWALDFRALRSYLEEKGLGDAPKRFDIPPPPSEIFLVETEHERYEFPLSEVRELVQPGCGFCEDMTSEFADISVGTLEGDESWNSVLVRTEKGLELFNGAVEAGVLEQKKMPDENMQHLREAASIKRQRALQNRERGMQ